MPHDGDAHETRDSLQEQLKTLRGEFHGESRDTRQIRAWPTEATHNAGHDRIPLDRREDHRNDTCCALQGQRAVGAGRGDDDVKLQTNKFSCEILEAICATLGGPEFYREILALDISQFRESPLERRDPRHVAR